MAADRLQAARLAGQLRRAPELALPFETDPTGFPMVWVDAIAAWMHWLPVSKLQFERRLHQVPDRSFDATWYDHMLALNPRVAPALVRPENYRNALLTGILPAEAQRFATRLGAGFAVPTLEQWLRAWSSLDSQPAELRLPAALIAGLEEPVRTLLTRMEGALAAAAARPRRQRTLADQMLLRRGVLEWVEQPGSPVRWVGIGEPLHLARGVRVSPDRGPVIPDRPEAFRSYLFGFRLIWKP
ncbi:MAG TPA: hypothetical protein VN970_03790 [Thermoanaerobaculia bacterium]|nr:hypothetical protein [Thermoanaerobaculia bacterium]